MAVLDNATMLLLGNAWDGERSDCFLAGGVLGGEAKQFLEGVPENVIRCPERRQLLRIA
jgi:hypothetical protein